MMTCSTRKFESSSLSKAGECSVPDSGGDNNYCCDGFPPIRHRMF